MKKAIEEYFPIVEINKLAVPERNSFKPIYQMHKTFAPRSSCVFRAILLSVLKNADADIIQEFYKDHINDPDTKDKVILDPFMGGGTTIVEALRLGNIVRGIDLNPISWFVVKNEIEKADVIELERAFERLSNRNVYWSGKTLNETLTELYRTDCPACGNKDAEILYTFWVKSAPCTSANCKAFTPLYSDYIVAQKKPSIRYFSDCTCPECKEKFDWEKEPASLIGDAKLMVDAPKYSAGDGRTSARWTFSFGEEAQCPWCKKEVKPKALSSKLKRKKVDLTVLLCPSCEEVWQFRGPLPEKVECPTCKNGYNPSEGNIPDKGDFICHGTCNGNKDKIITAIRKLPKDQLLPTKPYAIEGYCPHCSGKNKEALKKDQSQPNLFEDSDENEWQDISLSKAEDENRQSSLISKNKGKFFKRFSSNDFTRYQKTCEIWEKEKVKLPYPKSEIPVGEKTKSGLLSHHYFYWWQMFNCRQLLVLSTILSEIANEENERCKELLLLTFSSALERNNMFCRYFNDRNTIQGNFDRHDFAPKIDPCENSIWASAEIRGSFPNMFSRLKKGLEYQQHIYDWDIKRLDTSDRIHWSKETISGDKAEIHSGDSREVLDSLDGKVDAVITDPPYAGNVNYSELYDFYYVWQRLILKDKYPCFIPEYTPKKQEIVENPTRGLSNLDFRNGLQDVFTKSGRLLKKDGLLVFTYHHAGEQQWADLCDAVCSSGFVIECVYPIHGDKESSLNLQNNEAISYDLIHVCKKRENDAVVLKRSWAGVRHEIRQRARDEARLIEKGRYGNEPLSPADINILLIGKCLELYSKHYGAIVDHEDRPVPIKRALEEIKVLIDQIITKEQPLPTELSDIDIPSYIYFTTLCEKREIKSDDVNKSTRGIIEPAELHKCGLVRKGREKGGRTIEVKQPIERLDELREKFKNAPIKTQTNLFEDSASLVPNGSTPNGGAISLIPDNFLFVDYVHFLLGLAEAGENIFPWVERFRGLRPQIQAACEFLVLKNKKFESSAKKILGLIDERSLFFQKG
jgi:putative DNA methylase